VFKPEAPGRYPVIMSYGPYGKGVAFQEAYKGAWDIMAAEFPDALEGSSNKYANWEVCDPEKWVPDGYVVVRVDSRGAGRSPGRLAHNNTRENHDYHLCIEWAAAQPWSTGKVGLNGISYYAAAQWRAAATQPPHLAAICVWEGWQDNYRDANRHGGILCSFRKNWQHMQIKTVQHGVGTRGRRSPVTGELACGPETLSDEELAANAEDLWADLSAHTTVDDYYRERSADLSRVVVPLLSAGNWGGAGLHGRGNVEGYLGAASSQKWLEIHGGSHWSPFYVDAGVALQKAFFAHFLQGADNGWGQRPAVELQVRHVDRFEQRFENEWPIARTVWTPMHLDPAGMLLSAQPAQAGTLTYSGAGEGVVFMTAPFETETEITGPSALTVHVSSATADADLFLVLSLIAPDGNEVVFQGAVDPHTPVGQGWLRASHRRLDAARSQPWRPWHTHDAPQPLRPHEIVELQIEIWPTCIVVPPAYRIALAVRGKDYVCALDADEGTTLSIIRHPMRGCGPFVHDDEDDRPPSVFGGDVTLHFGPDHPATLLLPVIPRR
jgi:hypothetical protein